MWEGGWVRRRCPGCHPPPSPPGTATLWPGHYGSGRTVCADLIADVVSRAFRDPASPCSVMFGLNRRQTPRDLLALSEASGCVEGVDGVEACRGRRRERASGGSGGHGKWRAVKQRAMGGGGRREDRGVGAACGPKVWGSKVLCTERFKPWSGKWNMVTHAVTARRFGNQLDDCQTLHRTLSAGSDMYPPWQAVSGPRIAHFFGGGLHLQVMGSHRMCRSKIHKCTPGGHSLSVAQTPFLCSTDGNMCRPVNAHPDGRLHFHRFMFLGTFV